ncbi:hypothetical protein B0A49_05509 [Cryomyces minteri]|uniref:Uncharacterized protein n=1 Tax=Cryomyces minteri TaxID=331657 RepID=A0A4V5NG71_9PEZI|nr:hypothetical protein B0A49_05509 [Cryomyces minteri]
MHSSTTTATTATTTTTATSPSACQDARCVIIQHVVLVCLASAAHCAHERFSLVPPGPADLLLPLLLLPRLVLLLARPPTVSPLTPVATLASLAPISGSRVIPPGGDDDRCHDDSHDESHQPVPHPPATFIPRPAPLPFEQSSNTDVVALRATISLLQMQREKAKRDILALQEIKDRAATDPAAYLRAVQAGSVVSSNTHDGILGPTLATYDLDDDDPDDPDTRHTASAEVEVPDSTDTSPVSSFDTAHPPAPPPTTAFPPVPSPQNIVRMPPINWAKYAIVGAPLDALHAEARRRPDFAPAPDHIFAAPWSPFADRAADDDLRRDSAHGGRALAGHGGGGGGGAGWPAGGGMGGEVVHPMQTRRGSKKV